MAESSEEVSYPPGASRESLPRVEAEKAEKPASKTRKPPGEKGGAE